MAPWVLLVVLLFPSLAQGASRAYMVAKCRILLSSYIYYTSVAPVVANMSRLAIICSTKCGTSWYDSDSMVGVNSASSSVSSPEGSERSCGIGVAQGTSKAIPNGVSLRSNSWAFADECLQGTTMAWTNNIAIGKGITTFYTTLDTGLVAVPAVTPTPVQVTRRVEIDSLFVSVPEIPDAGDTVQFDFSVTLSHDGAPDEIIFSTHIDWIGDTADISGDLDFSDVVTGTDPELGPYFLLEDYVQEDTATYAVTDSLVLTAESKGVSSASDSHEGNPVPDQQESWGALKCLYR